MENDRRINNLEYEVESYKRKFINLEARANEATEMTEKVFQYESRINQMNLKMESYQRELEQSEEVKRENDALRKKVFELNELVGKLNEYEQKT